jgi:hypothetical protein
VDLLKALEVSLLEDLLDFLIDVVGHGYFVRGKLLEFC